MPNSIAPQLVLYLEATHPGGVTGVVEDLVGNRGPGERCVIIYRDTPAMREWGQTLSSPGCECVAVALRNHSDLAGWLDLQNLSKLKPLFKKASAVHFHLHTPFSCLPGIALAKRLRVRPLIATEHYISQIQFLRRRKLPPALSWLREAKIRILMSLKRRSIHALDQVVCVSESNRRFFLSTFGNDLGPKTTAIANAIDIGKFTNRSVEREKILSTLALPERPSYLVTVVAGLNNQKGHQHLIRAIPAILKNVPGTFFLFVGEGHLLSFLQDLARREGVAQSVVFTGRRPDIPEILGITDLVVLPSLFEGMPLSVLEAMAAGRAVVATNVDGTSEVVQDGITGYLVPPADSAALAKRISDLLMDESRRREFGRRGRQRIEEHFTLRRMLERYRALYREASAP